MERFLNFSVKKLYPMFAPFARRPWVTKLLLYCSSYQVQCMLGLMLRLICYLFLEPPVKQPTQLAAKQSVPTTSGKPVSKQPTVARKPEARKPAMKSTYNASYGRPSTAKSFMRPTSSRSSAKVYLDSVLIKDAKGKPSTSDSREKGNFFFY